LSYDRDRIKRPSELSVGVTCPERCGPNRAPIVDNGHWLDAGPTQYRLDELIMFVAGGAVDDDLWRRA
jgi:hypothetical protein